MDIRTQKKVASRHKWFSLSGVLSRALITASKFSNPPLDILVACGFGIVEMLGAKRLWQIVWPAFKHQFKEQMRALSNREKISAAKSGVDTAGDSNKPAV